MTEITLIVDGMSLDNLHIGTCSWKYDSWKGLIYPDKREINYLHEYSKHYDTVEIDQWFWSIFTGDKVVLPKDTVVQEYLNSVPKNFLFSIKVPNSITLTHHYRRNRANHLEENPHFLSIDLMSQFIERLSPLASHIGSLNFQFEYLNKQKIANQSTFLKKLGSFISLLPEGFRYCVETRNPNFINDRYFEFLAKHNLYHVFLQGYYMPSIFDIYAKHKGQIRDLTIIRLHGPDRKGIEQKTGKDWSQIVAPKDEDIGKLVEMLTDLNNRQVQVFLYVNNHFEGSAPRTIQKIEEAL